MKFREHLISPQQSIFSVECIPSVYSNQRHAHVVPLVPLPGGAMVPSCSMKWGHGTPSCTSLLYLNAGVRVCRSHLLGNKRQGLLIQITSSKDVGDGKHTTAEEPPGLYRASLPPHKVQHACKWQGVSITSCQQTGAPQPQLAKLWALLLFFFFYFQGVTAKHRMPVGAQAHGTGGWPLLIGATRARIRQLTPLLLWNAKRLGFSGAPGNKSSRRLGFAAGTGRGLPPAGLRGADPAMAADVQPPWQTSARPETLSIALPCRGRRQRHHAFLCRLGLHVGGLFPLGLFQP